MSETFPKIDGMDKLAYVRKVHEDCSDFLRRGSGRYHGVDEILEAINPLLSIGDSYNGLAQGINLMGKGLNKLERQMTIEKAKVVEVPSKVQEEKGQKEITVSKVDYVVIPSFVKRLHRLLRRGVGRVNGALRGIDKEDLDEELERNYFEINDTIQDCFEVRGGTRVYVAVRSLRRGLDDLRKLLFPAPCTSFNLPSLEDNVRWYVGSIKELKKFLEGKTEVRFRYETFNNNCVRAFYTKKKKE